MNRLWKLYPGVVALCLSTFHLHAGGSGLNVAIIINQDSTNSVQLGNYYREQRNIPPQNVFRIYWSGTNINWSLSDYNTYLLNPFVSALASRGLTNQIDYVVLSMDIPYRIDGDNTGYNENSTTSALYYGFKSDDNPPCDLAAGSTSLYAGSEGIFRHTPPISASSNSWLVTMITETNLALAEQIINQGVISDGTFPTQPGLLCKGIQIGYNSRYTAFDNAAFDTRVNGTCTLLRTNTQDIYSSSLILGAQTGAYSFGISPPPLFVPGAMADNLNSYGGQFLEYTSGESVILEFFYSGATGSYGTVTEPCAYLEKFPDPENYLYQARGFSLAECYYMSVTNPYQGLVAGEPLAAPFAKPATGAWVGLASNAVLTATTNLSVQFTASDALHPVQQLDLFLDGYWLQTVTNIAPQQSNVLKITLRGNTTNYVVTNNATIKSLTAGLVNALNSPAYTNLTRVQASAHGDRVELKSIDSYTTAGSNISLTAFSTNTSGSLTAFVRPSGNNFVDSIAWGYNSYEIDGTPVTGSTLHFTVTKTNGTMVTLVATNAAGNSDVGVFAQQFLNLLNTNASLDGSDGLTGEDFYAPSSSQVQFNLRALSQGYAAAQIRASLTASSGLSIIYNGNTALIDNQSDLAPRAHLYITAGTSNLSMTFPLVTTSLADGYHELDAVAYEGSHVHTQARASQNIIIQNTSLSATLNTVVGGSNSALEATLQFSVVPNTNTITKVELFSTGGSLGALTSGPYNFSVVATNLGLGLHPFYAIVTPNSGSPFRTATTYVRIIGPDSPFPLQIGAPPPVVLAWPATAGRNYDILAYTNAAGTSQVRATITASNTLAQWVETNSSASQLFYRVRVSP